MTTSLDGGAVLDVLLRDGAIAHLRLATEQDELAVTALDQHRRLWRDSSVPGGWSEAHLTRSSRAHSALVAVLDGVIVAAGGFARAERAPEEADLVVVVDDTRHHLGLGTLLLEHLAVLGRAAGIRAFLVSGRAAEDPTMTRVVTDSGFPVTSVGRDGSPRLRVDLAEGSQLWDHLLERDREAERASLDPVLRPTSLAVVGSSRPGSVASQVEACLVTGGFTGRFHRLDRSTRLQSLPEAPDLVLVAAPADSVLDIAQDAAERGARGLLVLSAGFAETGAAGRKRQTELLEICRANGIRLIGPNCLGVVNTDPAIALNATFCDARPRAGTLALVSQSGAVGIAALRHAERRGAGLSLFVSTGNKADVSGNDLLAYLHHDPRTTVIALYLESFGNAARFARLARYVGIDKPIVVVKAGRSAAGAQAGLSHTAAAATPEVAIDALLREAGVLRADNLDELFDLVTVLAPNRPPRGRRLAVIGNSGGPGVLAVDACLDAGLTVAELTTDTTRALEELLPTGASTRNPVDLLATVDAATFARGLDLIASDPGVDSIVAVYTPLTRGSEEPFAEAVAATQRTHPDVPLLAAFPGLAAAPTGLEPDDGPSVPFFEFPERAVTSLGRITQHALSLDRRPRPEGKRSLPGAAAAVRQLLGSGPQDTRWLNPVEATQALTAYGIACAEVVEVADADAAVLAGERLGYPLALKAVGATIVHKADLGGVALGLTTPDEVRRAYARLTAQVGPEMTGALVQHLFPTTDRLELIVGLTVDADVGPLLLVGAGGTLTDLLADRVVRLPPSSLEQAVAQVLQLRCAPLFAGYRHRPPLDLEATAQVLLALAQLSRELPELRELDINPLLVGPHDAVGLDVRIRVGAAGELRGVPARTLTR